MVSSVTFLVSVSVSTIFIIASRKLSASRFMLLQDAVKSSDANQSTALLAVLWLTEAKSLIACARIEKLNSSVSSHSVATWLIFALPLKKSTLKICLHYFINNLSLPLQIFFRDQSMGRLKQLAIQLEQEGTEDITMQSLLDLDKKNKEKKDVGEPEQDKSNQPKTF